MYTIQIATFDDIPNWKTIEVLDLPVVSFSNLHLRKTRVTVLLKLPATMEIETWLSESRQSCSLVIKLNTGELIGATEFRGKYQKIYSPLVIRNIGYTEGANFVLVTLKGVL